MVFVRGQVGQDIDTSQSVCIGDAAGQAEQAMSNVAKLLAEAGARLDYICKITIYLTDPRYREPVYRTIGRWLKGVYPVSTRTGCLSARSSRVAGRGRCHRRHSTRRLTDDVFHPRPEPTGR